MKTASKLLALLLALTMLAGCFMACDSGKAPADTSAEDTTAGQGSENKEFVDYASTVKFDPNSDRAHATVTVKTFVDGDTTHFNIDHPTFEGGILKARYLGVNTPESTGQIEPWGKKASTFTKETLSKATSIIVESDTATWNPDSTGDRFLVWVWYKTAEMEDYRCLNLEILQNGLAIANSSANNQYGSTCMAAINQARAQKLYVYSGTPDPDFYYGEAIELTLKELRTNIESYSGMKVAFTGIISANSGTQGVYIEDYDAETDLYYGIYIYYGHNLTGAGLDVLSVGNEARIVGTVQYYEGGGTWQVSDLSYRLMKPNDPGNVQKISSGHTGAYRLTDPDTFVNREVTLQLEDKTISVPYASIVMGTSVAMQNLQVTDIYTTSNEDSSSKGAMTMTCQANGVTVTVRTTVLMDATGNLITEDAYRGKVIDVKGIVDYFDGAYQVKVFSANHITTH